jgi:hypothetical protein
MSMDLAHSPRTTNPSQHATEILRGVGMLQLLESDPRPAFVMDAAVEDAAESIKPAYWNSAFAAIDSRRLLDVLLGKLSPIGPRAEVPQTYSKFRSWLSMCCTGASTPSIYCGHVWVNIRTQERWMVISGLATDAIKHSQSPVTKKAIPRKPSSSKLSTLDWTSDPPPARISPHIAWTRSLDWANTPLGAMTGWSSQLRGTANLVMQDPRPSVMFWGPELIMIYNEAYIELLGGFHPCMGVGARVALPLVWDRYFEPMVEKNLVERQSKRPTHPSTLTAMVSWKRRTLR